MIFEIFNCFDGETHGYRFGEEATKKTLERLPALYVEDKNGKTYSFDYLPARCGFYVLDMRNTVKFGPYPTHADATKKSDFENMASDTNSFHVYEQVN